MTDGTRTLEFRLQGLGLMEFEEGGPDFDPLLPLGESAVFTMRVRCPPWPTLDTLVLSPDGMPLGADPGRRTIRYERD